jgi:hypothetical protein
MDAMKHYCGLEYTWWVPASLFFAVLLISDIPTSLSVLYAFVTVVYIPGNFLVFFLFNNQKSESLLFLPAGFAFIPLLAYLSSVFSLRLVSPYTPPVLSLAFLLLMRKYNDVEGPRSRIMCVLQDCITFVRRQ